MNSLFVFLEKDIAQYVILDRIFQKYIIVFFKYMDEIKLSIFRQPLRNESKVNMYIIYFQFCCYKITRKTIEWGRRLFYLTICEDSLLWLRRNPAGIWGTGWLAYAFRKQIKGCLGQMAFSFLFLPRPLFTEYCCPDRVSAI